MMRMEFGYNEEHDLVKLVIHFERDVTMRLFEAAVNEIKGMQVFYYCAPVHGGNVSWFGAHGPFDLCAGIEGTGTNVEISLPFHDADGTQNWFDDKERGPIAPEWMWPEFIAPLRTVLEKAAS